LSTRTRVSRYADMVQGLINNGVSVVGSVLNDVSIKTIKGKK
jgi:hypothetical protein